MEKITLPAGFEDILPEQMLKWQYLEWAVRKIFSLYGFSEIRTPNLEDTVLFKRGIGENTDIVEKEMYTFGEPGDSVALRPEGTAPVIRSYIQNGQDKFSSFQKYWYMGPMFRHERPQKGRKRQFHQAGIEILGTRKPEADAESIILAYRLLQALRIKGFKLKINSTGCRECRPVYRQVLKEALAPHLEGLCGNCRRRYDTNIFRVLDCKIASCRAVFEQTPDILASLCPECAAHHEAVKTSLFDLKIEFEENRFLVRGLDYYTKTVYEFTHSGLGAQDAILGGGRYDNLVEEMGGNPQGAVGFAAGLDRIIAVMEDLQETIPREGVYLVALGEAACRKGFALVQELRNNGIKADIDFEDKGLKAQMKTANRRDFRMAAILGDDELAREMITFKDLESGSQVELPINDFMGRIAMLLRKIDEELKREVQDSEVRGTAEE